MDDTRRNADWSGMDPRIASGYELMWMSDAEFESWGKRVEEIVRQIETKAREMEKKAREQKA